MRGRYRSEVTAPSNVILLLESRESYPDLGDWWIPRRHDGNDPAKQPLGPFQSHNSMCNWLFADIHVKHLKLQYTCQAAYWTDGLPSRTNGCSKLNQIADEYK